MKLYRVVAAGAVLVAVTLSAACSSGSSSSASSSSSSSSKSTSSSSSKSSSSGGAVPTQAKAQSAMLTSADLTGFTLTDGQFTPAPVSTPLPCGQANPDAANPPALQVGSDIESAAPQASIVEDLSFYADTATATQAFQAGLAGVSCSNGSVQTSNGSIPVQLQTPTDVTSQVGGDKAIQVVISGSQLQAVIVAATKDNAVVTFQYATTPDADLTKLPNPTQLAALGIQKIANTLG